MHRTKTNKQYTNNKTNCNKTSGNLEDPNPHQK